MSMCCLWHQGSASQTSRLEFLLFSVLRQTKRGNMVLSIITSLSVLEIQVHSRQWASHGWASCSGARLLREHGCRGLQVPSVPPRPFSEKHSDGKYDDWYLWNGSQVSKVKSSSAVSFPCVSCSSLRKCFDWRKEEKKKPSGWENFTSCIKSVRTWFSPSSTLQNTVGYNPQELAWTFPNHLANCVASRLPAFWEIPYAVCVRESLGLFLLQRQSGSDKMAENTCLVCVCV